MISKYPIISPQGHNYHVEIENTECVFGEKGISVRIYELVEKNKLFGGTKMVKNHLYTGYCDDSSIEYLHYIKAVNKAVYNYEGSVEYKKKHSDADNLRRFNEWDGVCK